MRCAPVQCLCARDALAAGAAARRGAGKIQHRSQDQIEKMLSNKGRTW
jgi:hypothetical protein